MDDWNSSLVILRKIAAPLAFTTVVSSAGGIAMMIRYNQEIRSRDIFAAILASFAASTIVLLMLYGRLNDESPTLLYGVSALAGVGGASTLDLLLVWMRRWATKKGLLKDGSQEN